jgi:hypothetical protein
MLGPGPQKNPHTHYLSPGDAFMILVDLCFGLVRCGLLLLKGLGGGRVGSPPLYAL